MTLTETSNLFKKNISLGGEGGLWLLVVTKNNIETAHSEFPERTAEQWEHFRLACTRDHWMRIKKTVF